MVLLLKQVNLCDMLRVFYGWAKLNKIRKKEAISVIYENRAQREEKVQAFLKKSQETVYIRELTDEEMKDAEFQNRMFSEYSIRLDDKDIKGDVEKALEANFKADEKQLSLETREHIREELRKHYRLYHSGI